MTAAAPRQGARHIQLNLKRMDSGQVRVSTPQARGWATVARGPDQLWHAVVAAFAQASIAGHAAWLSEPYGHDERTAADDPDEPPRRRAPQTGLREGISWARDAAARPDVADPAEWTPLPDGTWLSPGGKRYRAASVLQPVIARRAALGLPTTFEGAAACAADADRFWARVADAPAASRWHTTDHRNPAARAAS